MCNQYYTIPYYCIFVCSVILSVYCNAVVHYMTLMRKQIIL